ncbi:MAG TPA: hypothetical protein VI036_10645 [Propionibacteriaceae bacterium]
MARASVLEATAHHTRSSVGQPARHLIYLAALRRQLLEAPLVLGGGAAH